ncbi:MAG TPA: UDP-N-acetylmuramoyl-L-alanine--D-glutamate ligase [Actinomycetota bacterium]|nr:UDP-N-acetylmuramoyl-L-alanine--D-glutamate ligase [Actinomycetota bacterium]
MTGAFAGERAVVVGFGASGRAAANVLAAEGAEVWVTEARTLDELEMPAKGQDTGSDGTVTPEVQVEVLAGGHRPEHLDGATMVVVSPGVPQGTEVLGWARERGLPIWSELELGARLCRVPFVAVTGTNGKTTTVELLAAMMRAAGLSAQACGNIGFPFSLAARDASLETLAVECSSFQLVFQESLRPKVSVLLNLAPDHLDWHGSFDGYAAAKARIFARQAEGDTHVGNRDDPVAAQLSRRAPCAVRWFGWGRPAAGDVGVADGHIVAAPGDSVTGDANSPTDLGILPTQQRSFLADSAAAAAAGLAFGLPWEAVGSALRTFAPLPHRGAVVARAGSVRFVDDSKATNPHAALAALEGLHDAVLIAGGLAKGVDLAPLASAAASLSAVVAMGEAAPALAEVFHGLVPVLRAASMEEAVEMAFSVAQQGGTVILAPACASQDMFRDYRDRGERFAAAARAVSSRVESEGSYA